MMQELTIFVLVISIFPILAYDAATSGGED